MAIIESNISQVRAIELPAGIWADGEAVAVPRVALVKWRSGWTDKLHQVYVNGRYAGATLEVGQRQQLVHLPISPSMAVRIEVFAVEPAQGHIDFSDELEAAGDSGRVRITLLRDQSLPIDSVFSIYSDNGSGEIDYDNPLNESPIRIWAAWQDKAGWGMSSFGESDFGYDGSAAVGFGKGSFGNGQFGLDADSLEWISEPLSAGVYKFAVRIMDSNGNESAAALTGEITVIPVAEPAEQLDISSFDKQTNQLVLSVS